jgi:2-keto-4-pentenoate hydratase
MIRDGFSIQSYVDRLLAGHDAGTTFSPLRYADTPISMEEAYAVQGFFSEALARKAGTTIGGFKIGLTSDVMQKMCGIDRPIYGSILENTFYTNGKSLNLARYSRVGLEFEIAVKLGSELPDLDGLSRENVAPCVEAICPALEIVDDRGADYSELDAASLTADNSWSAGAVLGEWRPLPTDLASRRGRVNCDGNIVGEGLAGDVLGHPLEVVIWIARELALTGKSVPAGSIIMTGSIVRTQFVRPGQYWAYDVEGLGKVHLSC